MRIFLVPLSLKSFVKDLKFEFFLINCLFEGLSLIVGRTCNESIEDRVLRRIFLMFGGQVTGNLIQIFTEGFRVLLIVPNFIWMRISFISHVTCIGELGMLYNVLICWSDGRERLVILGVDVCVKSKWNLIIYTGGSTAPLF